MVTNNIRAKMRSVKSNTPVGNLTVHGGGHYVKDELGRLYTVKSAEQSDVDRRRKYAERDQRHFSFTNMHNMREITDTLSNKYCGYILLLQPYIAFKSGLLVAPGREGRALKSADFAGVWNVSKRTANVILDELEAHSIVFGSNGSYTLNDRYHFRNKTGDEVDALIKTFFTTLRRVRLTAADLGLVYKMLPYVHLETNVICSDPFADNPGDIRYLNEKQIAGIVGLSVVKTRDALRRLRKTGMTGEWVRGDGDDRETLTVLNPYVFYRKAGEPDKTLQALFASQRFDAA